jgi:mono/diheme cytochrome c family protein
LKSRSAIYISLLLGIITIAAVITWSLVFRPKLPAAERGRRIAEREGCFNCHGPEGSRGTANPGSKDRTVPDFQGDLMMYAKDEGEIREWIRDGVPTVRAKSKSWQEQRDLGALKMPAYGDRLTSGEIDDLVSFIMAVGGVRQPEDSLARRGLMRARELGCFGCHGAGGRLARHNPGSLKGYIPSWDGADFPELVRNREEFSEWVVKGVCERFEQSPFASVYLKRAAIQMPAYEKHLESGDVEALWAYVLWLRD